MSDDLRRAYLLGAGHSLYGNLPGTNPEASTQNQNTGLAFAAMPRNFEQNDPFHHGRAGGRTPYMSNRPLKADGGLNLQEKTWSGATYMLAPCPATTDPQDVKSLVLEHAIESIRSGNGKWRNKVDCLVNHFNQTLILTSATLALEDFKNYDSGLYGYVFLNAQNVAHRPINIPGEAATEVTITNFRAAVRYISAEMTVDARQRFATPGPGAQLLPGADTKVILFRLPIGPAGSLHDAIALDTIRDLRQVVSICKYIQNTLQFGMIERDQFSQDRFNAWLDEVKQQTRYEVVAKLLRPAFVGEGIIETPVTRLIQCQQRGTNDKGQTTAATVTEHYTRFTAIVQQLNPEVPFPVNLPTTFFNSLTAHMQGKINRRQYRLPPPSTNEAQLEQLRKLRDIAAEEEKDIETQIQLIKTTLSPAAATRPYGNNPRAFPPRAPAARTFMATGEIGNTEYGDQPATSTDIGHDNEGIYGYSPHPYPQYQSHANMHEDDPLMEQFNLLQSWMGGEPQAMATCFLSPAESALRNASGTEKPIECWGCTGHAMYHATRYHSFRDCPNKYDPDVRRVAFRRMKQMREEWENRKQTTAGPPRKREGAALLTRMTATSDWRELGFASRRDAERSADAAAMMAANISAYNRQCLNKAWLNKWGEATTQDETARERNADGYYGPGPGSSHNNDTNNTYHFIARVFQAVPTQSIPLEISPTLPHCLMPIGPTFGKGKLKVALDSCAGVNIGHLEFHKAMAEIFPELVASFKTMQEYGERDVNIGGVEISSTALKITHIIEYKTPFRYNGTPCNLTFGLSEQAAATAIISINFLRKTKALWSYDDAEPNIHLTIWNLTLRVSYEPPTRRPTPTPRDRFRAETTAVYTAGVRPQERNGWTTNVGLGNNE
jgi:hypothetical protein